ncbi:hypothetical protein BDV19DRAFT_391604 [Aspergillus venezuelensis]
MAQPKRIVLRISSADFDEKNMYEAVYVYFEKTNRSTDELSEQPQRHYIHITPDNSHIPQRDPKVHIVIDLEISAHSGPLSPDFPHELYRMKRVDGEMKLGQFADGPYYQNFLSKIRGFSDDMYPWGCTMQDIRIANGTADARPVED